MKSKPHCSKLIQYRSRQLRLSPEFRIFIGLTRHRYWGAMAHVAIERSRVIALADTTSTKANLTPRPLSINRAATPRPLYPHLTRKDSLALRPVVRCTPDNKNPLGISPHQLTRLVCSPYRPKVLRAKGYLFDETLLPNMEAIRKRSTPKSSRSRSRYSPHTPPNPPARSAGSRVAVQSAASRRVAQPVTPTAMVPAPPPKDTPDPRIVSIFLFCLSAYVSLDIFFQNTRFARPEQTTANLTFRTEESFYT